MSKTSIEATKPLYRRLVLVIGTLAGVAAPYNFFKVAPLIPALMDEFKLTEASASLLMMLFAICITILSLPAGIATARLGPKKVAIVGLLCIMIGSAIGAMATSVLILFLGRIPEGIGMALLMTSVPALIVPWFPPEKVGIVMAIWANFMPFGNIFGLNISGLIAPAYGWRGAWWIGFIFAVIMIILVMLVKEKMPPKEVKTGDDPRKQGPSIRQTITNRDLWLVALAFLTGLSAPMAFLSLGPTYLNVAKGLDITYATFVTSLFMVFGILGTLIGGVISDKIRSRKIVYTTGLGLSMIFYPIFPYLTGLLIPLIVIIWGFMFSLVPPAVFAVPPDLLGPETAGIGLGIVNAGLGLAMGYPPLMWGLMLGVLGSWEIALDTFLIPSVVGVVIGWLPKKVK